MEEDVVLLVTVRCYDCTPEQAAQGMRDHYGFTTPGDGEVEILDARTP